MRVGIQIAPGDVLPAAARTIIVPDGAISVMAEVLIATKSTIALEALCEPWLRVARSFMAFRPKGVAAFPIPMMFDAMFITIDPIAGWSGGTSGKRRRSTGPSARAIQSRSPPSKATRVSPRKKIIPPTSLITSSIDDLAVSKIEAYTGCI